MTEMTRPVRYLNRLSEVTELAPEVHARLRPVTDTFVFRSNTYYTSLIDWSDPADPIRRLAVPEIDELEDWGALDASDEHRYTKVPGLQHKYPDTALLLVNDVCATYCRFCFRKRLFLEDNEEVVKDVTAGLEYIRSHREIDNVLLTGGDPLVMAGTKLRPIIAGLRAIDHVRIIRIGSKMPAFDPLRLLRDAALRELLQTYSTPERRIYVMAHFTHPRELTPEALDCVAMLQHASAIVVNQTPMIAGINDNADTLRELFNRLSFAGVSPYYVFQCRPTRGNKHFSVPIERAYAIFTAAQSGCSGLARRARFVMSHVSGKIEVVGLTAGEIILRYCRAADPAQHGQVMLLPRNPDAHWPDDYAGFAPGLAPEDEALVSASERGMHHGCR